MGRLIGEMDWSDTTLGSVDQWPQSLRTTVSICLASDLPICVIWGPGLVQLYNDAYRVICGDKHPQSMGQKFSQCWQEAWPVIGSAHDSALVGDTAFLEGQQVYLQRHGYVEECFFTFSFSPIRDEAGQVGGLFHPVIEVTAKMLAERRTRALRDLTLHTSQAKSVAQALALASQSLASYDLDLSFSLLYALNTDGQQAQLAGSTGLKEDALASLQTVAVTEDPTAVLPLATVQRLRSIVEVNGLRQRLSAAVTRPYPEPVDAALLLPIIRPGTDRLIAILVAGISASLPLNEAYRSFYDLLASAVTTAVANAASFEDERQQAKALAELDRAKTAFFSNVSHEFRTPLTLMLGPVEDALAASDEPLPSLQRERLEIVYRNGLRLQRLVNNLLEFSRIEAGRVRAAFEPTDIADFTAELASNFRSACERAGLELRVECPRMSEQLFVDRPMWEKIVLNLLSNAFKFTFSGEIFVSMRQVGDVAELRVQDTGTGILSEEIPRLFERFHRVENARGRTHEGSGIGLALVHELVKLHGGSISATSEVGSGTTFTVRVPLGSQHLPHDQVGSSRIAALPTAEASPFVEEALRWLPDAELRPATASELQQLADKAADPASAPHSSLHSSLHSLPDSSRGQADDNRPLVLVADDNADMRQYIVRLLGSQYRTDAVPDGQAALEAARARLPALVLTDVMMPRLDGFGLLKALRADPRTSSLPVIMLSARAGEESRIEGLHKGADDYIVKPFSGRELLARVTAHLQMAQMRREASAAIQASEEQFRALVSASSDVVYRMNADWTEMRHLQGREFIADTLEPNRSWLEKYIHPDDQQLVTQTIREAIQTKGVFELEHRVLRVDGALGWTFSRAVAMLDSHGQIKEWFGAASDVTARKQAEFAIRAEEERSRTILESITDGYFTVSSDWRITYINAAGERFLDRNPGDLIGKSLWEEFPGTVGTEFERVYRRVAASQVGESFTAYYPNFDRWYELNASPAPRGLTVYFRDVSDERRTHEALRTIEEQRDLALSGAELGMWHVDPATRATKTDARYRAIFGTTDEWTDYLQAVAIIHPDDQPAVVEAVATATRLDNPAPYSIEYRIIHPDGSVHWIFAKGRSSFEGAGEARRVASFDGTVADITERKRGEQEREQLVARLQEQDQRKDEFLATLAHELRNPLAPIRNGLQILRQTKGDLQATEKIRLMMERQVNQMVHLIDDLLDLSRISRGKIALRKERIDLATAIEQAIEATRPSIENAGHLLVMDMPKEPIYVDADLTRLTQIFSNLLNNAAKFTGQGGHVQVAVVQAGTEVKVTVTDNGIGIAADMLTRVFEMFTQVDGGLGQSHGGLGIGLSIVQRLVQMHDGSVEVRSEGLGRGSEFVVQLPLAIPLVASKPAVKNITGDTTARLRILVADDNVDAADSLAMLLTLEGYDTQTAHDGQEALSRAQVFRPDVMLLDIGMPKLNGHEVCRNLRLQPWGKKTVVIALTGWGQETNRQQSQAAGFDFHLVKPVEYDAVKNLLVEVAAKI